MVSINLALVAGLATASSAMAHMQLEWPLPYRSTFNPATTEAMKDYSMTQPLGTYPCKGYIDTSASPVVTWSAGQTYNYTLAGTAIHGGGSCQLSLSYDGGSTWNVINSYMGGCVLDGLTNDFVIPSDAPSGKAIFSWSWFNLIGNREMYQNCASVEITGGGSGLSSSDYPAPFVANVEAAPSCHTVEGTAVVFPNPGKKIKYGSTYASTKPTEGAGYTGDCGSAASGSGSNSTSSSAAYVASSTVSASSPISSVSISSTNNAIVSSTAEAIVSSSAFASSAPVETTATSTVSTLAAIETGKKRCNRKKRDIAKRHQRLIRRSNLERHTE